MMTTTATNNTDLIINNNDITHHTNINTNTKLINNNNASNRGSRSACPLSYPLSPGPKTGLFLADRVVVGGAVAETCIRALVPGYRERIVRHEAGHFLVAYLLGCPVQGCLLDPLTVSWLWYSRCLLLRDYSAIGPLYSDVP